jgi:hypothetical protein
MPQNSPESVPPALAHVHRRRIKRFAPLKLGLMLGLAYALLSIVAIPFFLLAILGAGTAARASGGPHMPFMFGLGAIFVVFIPVIYGIMGFICGVLAAFVYNIVAKWIGGIEVEVE